MLRPRLIALWCALAVASCELGVPNCRCAPLCVPGLGYDLDDPRAEGPDGTWEILPHKVIGPCTYQYEPPTKSWGGSVAVEIDTLAYPYYEVDKEKRILRITDCPGGQPSGHPDGGVIDIVFNYDKPRSAQPEYYESSPDELDRKMFPRKPPR